MHRIIGAAYCGARGSIWPICDIQQRHRRVQRLDDQGTQEALTDAPPIRQSNPHLAMSCCTVPSAFSLAIAASILLKSSPSLLRTPMAIGWMEVAL
jgi:hypothetical protein